MQIKTLKFWAIFLVCILYMAACQENFPGVLPNPTPTLDASKIDNSMFTDMPCKAPCWYGLQLNESSKEDVLTVLHGLTFISQSTIQESSVGYWDPFLKDNIQANLISANCAQPQNRQCIGLTIADGKLKIIGLFPNQEIRFDVLVNHLGPPDYVGANLIPPVHSPGCSVNLIWVSRQIVADHTEKSSTTLCDEVQSGMGIKPSLLVNSITYFLPEYIELRIASSEALPWMGFANP